MAKLKAPLLGLHPSGSLGNNITFAGWKGITIVKKKSIPRDPRTWPQVYHRWLYQDYAYLWYALSDADKRTWGTAGVRLGLPGYQAFMRHRLTNLPDIAGMWHLDEGAGNIAHDSSRNTNNGTLYGPLWTDGVFSKALSFDGIDDRVNFGTFDPSPTDLTILLWYYWKGPTATHEMLVAKRDGWSAAEMRWQLGRYKWEQKLLFGQTDSYTVFDHDLQPTAWTLLALVHDTTADQDRLYSNNTLVDTKSPAITFGTLTSAEVTIGARSDSGEPYKGILEEPRFYNRVLSLTEIKRHYERGLPYL